MTVFVPVRLKPAQMKQFKALSMTAIQTDIANALEKIRVIASMVTPVWTGRLKESFKAKPLPFGTGVMFSWSAIDPISRYDYAKVVDEGRPKGRILTPKRAKAMAFPSPWQGGPIRLQKRAIQGAITGRHYSDIVQQAAVRILLEELKQQFIIHLQAGG